MIYRISGTIILKRDPFAVVDVGGVGFKVTVPPGVFGALPETGNLVTLFTHLHVREDALDLYGFLREDELFLFESLNGVSGIGPKSALGIMGVAKPDQLIAAINEGRTELLTRASGIGKKTAERVILELKGKLSATSAPQTLTLMESDLELEETLISLGYSRNQAKAAIGNVDPKTSGFKDRLKEALKKAKS
jgi:Holliday junction DNA helicase RuvA